MNRKLQQQINAEFYRETLLPCACENNGDYCTGCEARRELKRLTDDRVKRSNPHLMDYAEYRSTRAACGFRYMSQAEWNRLAKGGN